MSNQVHQPTHYMSNGEETIVKIVRELGISGAIQFCKGNIIKYADRANYKGQKESDLEKIQEYTKMADDLKFIQLYLIAESHEKNIANTHQKYVDVVKAWSENGHSLEGAFDE